MKKANMALDVKNIIAAINPDLYCDNVPDPDTGKKLSDEVKKIVKTSGYLKAAEKAKLRESDYIDVIHTRFTKGAFELRGLEQPIEQHKMVYDASAQSLEPIYFWILDYVNEAYGESQKLVDNFISSPGSGHFAELQARATRMQDEGMKILGAANTVVRSILNIVYDLKEFKIRLAKYDDLKSSDKKKREAAKLGLKQIWMDKVDAQRGAGSINGLAQQLEFVTIRDAFMIANSIAEIEQLDLNDRVKRILKQRVAEFELWIKESERELRKRYEIEKTYLRSQVNSTKLYARWAKPYLKAARQLEQNVVETAALVNAFNTTLFELVLLAKGKYDFKKDVEKGELPKKLKRMKLRTYYPLTIIEFKFRSIPDRSDGRGGYSFRGRVEITFTSCVLNDDELALLKEKVTEDDLGDVYKMISGATDESLGELKADLDEFLDEKKNTKMEVKNSEEDSNPFSALFSFLKGEEKQKTQDFSSGILKDNFYERVLRSQAILAARMSCRGLYDRYKKVNGMPAFPPTIS